jgi:hypothetical protein
VDTVDNFHGLERLIAIALCLDKVGSPEAIMQSRARLYCAVTRAQFFVVVVNEFLRGGCTEFLGHLELRENQDTVDAGEVNRQAASALIHEKEEQSKKVTSEAAAAEEKHTPLEGTRADARGIGEVGGGTDQTERRVSSPRPP